MHSHEPRRPVEGKDEREATRGETVQEGWWDSILPSISNTKKSGRKQGSSLPFKYLAVAPFSSDTSSPCFSQYIAKSLHHHPKSRYHHVTSFPASVSLLWNVMFWCSFRAQGSWDGAMARGTLTQRSSYVHRCVARGPSKLGNFDFFSFLL